jgi:hypothetical protein
VACRSSVATTPTPPESGALTSPSVCSAIWCAKLGYGGLARLPLATEASQALMMPDASWCRVMPRATCIRMAMQASSTFAVTRPPPTPDRPGGIYTAQERCAKFRDVVEVRLGGLAAKMLHCAVAELVGPLNLVFVGQHSMPLPASCCATRSDRTNAFVFAASANLPTMLARGFVVHFATPKPIAGYATLEATSRQIWRAESVCQQVQGACAACPRDLCCKSRLSR